MVKGTCHNRAESAAMNDLSRSLVLVNYFRDLPNLPAACKDNSAQLLDIVTACHDKSGDRWPNFIAVDFYKVSQLVLRRLISSVAPSSTPNLGCGILHAEERPGRRSGGHGQGERRPGLRLREHIGLQRT
jgi:hypothetical protein